MFRSIMRGDLGLLGASACIRQVMIRRIRRCSGPGIRTWQGNNLKNSLLRVNIFQQIIWQQRLDSLQARCADQIAGLKLNFSSVTQN